MTPTSKAAQAMTPCAECGMPCATGEYHPYAACLMFKACHNSETVRSSLEAIKDHALAAQPSQAQAAEAVDVDAIMAKIPTAARLYYTGIGSRRYRRASTMTGPGEPLVHRSHVERELRQIAATPPASPVASEREGLTQAEITDIRRAAVLIRENSYPCPDKPHSNWALADRIEKIVATRTGSDK